LASTSGALRMHAETACIRHVVTAMELLRRSCSSTARDDVCKDRIEVHTSEAKSGGMSAGTGGLTCILMSRKRS